MSVKIDPELKTRWVEALRSKKYTQGHHVLKEEQKDGSLAYCCLGVLCEISGIQNEIVPSSKRFSFSDKDGSTYQAYLPPSFKRQVGLSSDMETRLGTMNDGGDSFEKIADFIEEKL